MKIFDLLLAAWMAALASASTGTTTRQPFWAALWTSHSQGGFGRGPFGLGVPSPAAEANSQVGWLRALQPDWLWPTGNG